MSTAFAAFNLLIFASVFAFLPLLIGVYVYRDAKRRNMNAPLWTIIAILAPSLIGFIIYLLVRGNYSNLKCPRCEATVTEQFVVCPKCGAKLRPTCPNCSMAVEPDWSVCPKCTHPLPTVQDDITTPVRPKDKTLWKILVAIIAVPVILILLLGISFTAVSGGGSSSLREISFDEYYADQETPETTKQYVREWMEGIEPQSGHAYALRYTYRFDPESDTKDYYYLIYIPGGGNVSNKGFGYSSGLFTTTFKLDLNGGRNEDGLYCALTSSKKAAPELRVTLDGKRLEDEVTVVDFNPTLYTIASESDYSALKAASGDLYVESEEREMNPELITLTKYVDGQQYGVAKFNAPDFMLNTVVGIHELHYMDGVPDSLLDYEFKDYFTISIRYVDDTGKYHYEDYSDYLILATESSYYLVEVGMYSEIEDILDAGHISAQDKVFVYEINEADYGALNNLFNKP